MIDYTALGIFTGLTAAAAVTGSRFGPGQWYLTLNKPSWTPPGWVFPVVWTTLYVMIAIAGYLVWQVKGWSPVVIVWGTQLLLNALWSWIMFGQKKIGLALGDIVLMWIAIAAFIVLAWPVSRTAAYLFMPYLLWVSIAFTLNLRIWQMNPRSGG
jgi:translocator protein